MSSFVKVFVPENHSAMFSLVHLDVGADDAYGCSVAWLSLYKKRNTSHILVWRACNSHHPPPLVVHTELLHVFFRSHFWPTFAGFRLLFSFHPVRIKQAQ